MDGIDFWRLADELSVLQATLLVCGIDPSGKEHTYERLASRPRGYDALKHALITSIQNGTLEGREIRHVDPQYGEEYVDINQTLLRVDALKEWLKEKGIREHFFFFPEEEEGEFLWEHHPRYSAKLAAAVRAWQALDGESLEGKTPKQMAKKWLNLHATEYGLTGDDGRPIESAIEEISKIVNWSPKGGAPSTPSGTGSSKPTIDKAKNTGGKNMFSILKEQKSPLGDDFNFDLDDEIPF